mgnify:CR=1 FL=1
MRLRQDVGGASAPKEDVFQSHNGAIAAHPPHLLRLLRCRVSIPQWCDCCHHHRHQHSEFSNGFNPTMVRLLHGEIVGQAEGSCHVSIPQWCDCCQRAGERIATAVTCFNPTMVRLLLSQNLFLIVKQPQVSIPQWCDCCTTSCIVFTKHRKSFNPTMVRLLQALNSEM